MILLGKIRARVFSLGVERLTSRGAAMLSELLLDLYEPVDLPEFRQRMLGCIGGVLPNEVVCHNEINGPGGASLSVLRPTIDNFEPLRSVFFQHAAEHPSLTHLMASGDASAVKTSDFVSQREFRRRGLYRDFYEQLRVRYQLTFGFRTGTGALAFVAVSRWHRDFTEQERSVLTLFRPHFVQAYRRAELRHATSSGAAAAEDIGALSQRERETLYWLTEGKTNEEIATILGISLATVKTHLAHIYAKLDVDSRTAACRRAFDAGHVLR
jgi:DNA-binding CsgD family transcriptional regulator